MARKKQTRKSRKKQVEEPESLFWPLAGAIVMFLLAAFLLLGGFGTGGPLPKGLFGGVYWALGWAAYFSPIALVYYGVIKFRAEDKKIPLPKLISMLGALVFTASWLYVSFAHKDFLGVYVGGHGGEVGRLVGSTILNAIDKWPAGIMFFIFALLSFFYAFGVSPQVLVKITEIFKHDYDEAELAGLKQKADVSGFKMNEGVPVEHNVDNRQTAKVAAEKVASSELHEALTVASDPDWKFPDMSLLNQQQDKANAGDVEGNAAIIKETFENFGIKVDMEGANIGPRVTQYTLKPPAGLKLSKLGAHDRDLEYSLAAQSVRVEAPIPGKKLVGIEVPNQKPATVRVSSVLMSEEWKSVKSPLSMAIGKDISGQAIVQDLDEMPHLLVAGQTKAGKSVMINAILTSLLFQNSPSDLKLILVDPKQVELKPYDEIPHLLTPVISDTEKCISALKWTVAEMERRYKALSEVNCRDIKEYNELKDKEGMPFIVIIIDELSDLMSAAPRDLEALIVRVAQKSRAVGIHLILATQSPRVKVITGLIKANVPARIAFTVGQEVDSRVILDLSGAEKLLGKGDMLLKTYDIPKPKRVQGALVETAEVRKLTDFLRAQRAPQYDDEIISQPVQLNGRGGVVAEVDPSDEPIFKEAVKVVIDSGKASTSLLQRRLRIGYGKAARIIESMEEQGIIGPADGSRPRDVLVSNSDEVFASGNSGGVEVDEASEEDYEEVN